MAQLQKQNNLFFMKMYDTIVTHFLYKTNSIYNNEKKKKVPSTFF